MHHPCMLSNSTFSRKKTDRFTKNFYWGIEIWSPCCFLYAIKIPINMSSPVVDSSLLYRRYYCGGSLFLFWCVHFCSTIVNEIFITGKLLSQTKKSFPKMLRWSNKLTHLLNVITYVKLCCYSFKSSAQFKNTRDSYRRGLCFVFM